MTLTKKQMDSIRHRKRYLEDRESILRKNRLYQEKNKDRIRLQRKEYRQRNKDTIRSINRDYVARNRDRANRWNRRWREKNRARVAAQDSNRRAIELGACSNPEKVAEFYSWIRNQDFVTCTYCGKYIHGKSVEIDHIVPLTRGGIHDPENFCISCRPCNASKHNKMLWEWSHCPDKFKSIIVG